MTQILNPLASPLPLTQGKIFQNFFPEDHDRKFLAVSDGGFSFHDLVNSASRNLTYLFKCVCMCVCVCGGGVSFKNCLHIIKRYWGKGVF